MRIGLRLAGLALVALLGFGRTAQAAPILHFAVASVDARVIDNTGVLAAVDSVSSVVQGSLSAGPHSAFAGGTSAFAYALNGVLGASVIANSSVTATLGESGSASASVADTFTLVSSVLPIGTPVTLAFNTNLHGILSSSFDPNAGQTGCGTVNSFIQVLMPGFSQNVVSNQASTCIGVPTLGNHAGVFQTAIGQEFSIVASLSVSARGRLGGSGVANFANTLQWFVDPAGTNFSYTTVSGSTYFTPQEVTPVPEPATLALLGSGLAAVAAARRRRQRI